MQTKYYTPTIEEFHVGFEFERELVDCNWNHSEWQKETVTSETNFKILEEYKSYNRVKCLCREDIESLGWELDSCVKKEWFYIHKKSNLQDGTIRLTFRQKEQSVEISWVKSGNYFYGKIKNKSELKKLMQQLNIE